MTNTTSGTTDEGHYGLVFIASRLASEMQRTGIDGAKALAGAAGVHRNSITGQMLIGRKPISPAIGGSVAMALSVAPDSIIKWGWLQ